MSIDRSLRIKSSLVRHRNVLSRAERIALLKDSGRWQEERSALGLPKVSHRKVKATKKAKKEAETPAEGAAPATGAAPAAPGAGGKAPPGGKGGAAKKA